MKKTLFVTAAALLLFSGQAFAKASESGCENTNTVDSSAPPVTYKGNSDNVGTSGKGSTTDTTTTSDPAANGCDSTVVTSPRTRTR